MAGSLTTARAAAHGRDIARERTGISLSWLWTAAVLVLAAGAFAVRLYRIDGDSLWLDEGYTLLFSGMPLPKLLLVGGAHEHPPLYYLIVHTMRAIHESSLIPRYVSAVCGTLSLLAVYALGMRIHSRAAGFVAAVLTAVAPFHVWFSRDGRGYELAGLLVVLAYYWVFTALDRPRRAAWIAYALTVALCLYGEYTTVFALAPQVVLLARARERRLMRPMALSWSAAVLLFLPWVTVLAVDAASIAGNYWIPAPNLTSWSNTVLEFLGLMTSCSAHPCSGTELGVQGLAGREVPVTIVAAVLAVGTGVAAAWRRNLVVCVLSAWLVGSFALVLLISIGQSLFLDRVLLDATFPLYLLLGIGVASLSRRPKLGLSALGLTLLVTAASVATLRPIYAFGANPDWKTAMRDFSAAYRAGQGAVFYPGALRSVAAAYLPQGWRATRDIPIWSRIYVDVPGWKRQYPTLINPTSEQRAAVEVALRNRQLGWATEGTSGIWLITQDYSGISDTRRWFVTHGYALLLSEMYARDARVEYWSRNAPSSFGPLVVQGGDGRWQLRGAVSRTGSVLRTGSGGSATRSFSVHSGQAYTVSVGYHGAPPVAPHVGVLLYDANGKQIAAYPATHWYDLPANGTWIENPFGFIAPPGAVRAMLYVTSRGGPSEWRDLAVYRER